MKRSFEAWGLRWSRTRERGATAIVIALCFMLIVAAAAFSFDTANLALKRQTLQNIVDASAQAGASFLPSDPAGAYTAALQYAQRYDPTLAPPSLNLTLWCIVGSTGVTKQPVAASIGPWTCDPGTSATYVNGVGGVVCDTVLCAIPCSATAPACNTMRVEGHQDVPFYFAPAIGIPTGKTGSVIAVSCKGACGAVTPNPMDVAFVADRTTSLAESDLTDMKTGIDNTLTTMTPEYQFVTLGTIHKSTPITGCDTNLATYTGSNPDWNAARNGTTTGKTATWMPMGFSNDYRTGALGDASRPLKASSKLVVNVGCMNRADPQPWGTHLAAPLKAAARMLLGKTSSNLGALTTARKALLPVGATVKQAIIMETDGVPEETIGFNGSVGSTNYKDNSVDGLGHVTLDDATDPVSGNPSNNGELGCTNLQTVASEAKTAGIIVIMIAYGDATKQTTHCKKGSNSGTAVGDALAASASWSPSGFASDNDKCDTDAQITAENTDGDFYFCAVTGTQLASIFNTAMSQLNTTTKFVKMPK